MTPRQRSETDYTAMSEAIKAVARDLMADSGAAGLSLRAIARRLDRTAPALYHYFPSLDALITALIVDDFNALADALEAARDAYAGPDRAGRLRVVLDAYRCWALDHPVDFQLIYGTPIPGYTAPAEITVPAAARGFHVVVALIAAVLESGPAHPLPPYDRVPPALADHVDALLAREMPQAAATRDAARYRLALYLGVVGWTQLHGLITLELNDHLPPVIGDCEVFFHLQMDNLMHTMGLDVA